MRSWARAFEEGESGGKAMGGLGGRRRLGSEEIRIRIRNAMLACARICFM